MTIGDFTGKKFIRFNFRNEMVFLWVVDQNKAGAIHYRESCGQGYHIGLDHFKELIDDGYIIEATDEEYEDYLRLQEIQ
jgi:hypothetical protein